MGVTAHVVNFAILHMRAIDRREMDRDSRAGDSKRPWAPLAVDYGMYSPLVAGSIDGTDDRPHDRAVERAMMSSCKLVVYM